MTRENTDVLELLLESPDAPRRDRARRMVTFLRLLADDARGCGSETVGVGLEDAREEMGRLERRGLVEVLEELVIHHLRARREGDSFATLGATSRGVQTAWSELEHFRGDDPRLPEVPAPGEAPEAVVTRLVDGLEGGGAEPEDLAGWRARARRSREGAEAGERAWQGFLDSSPSRAGKIAAVRAVAECRLDRGAVRGARDWLDRHLGLVSSAPSLRRLHAWTHLFTGDREAAEELAHGLAAPRGEEDEELPASLGELRDRIPAWASLLPGAVRTGRDPEVRAESGGRRGDVGAAFLAVFVADGDGGGRAVHLDASPGLRPALDGWLRDREGSGRVAGEPERRLLVEGRAVFEHRLGTARLRGALGARTSLALALQPILDVTREVRGWIHVECEHHLLPSRARLEAWAGAWGERIGKSVDPAEEAREERTPRLGSATKRIEHPPLPAEDPRVSEARQLLPRLGVKLALRRWWLFDVAGDQTRLVAEGGGALEEWRREGGEGRGVRRGLAGGATVGFRARDPRLSLHAGAASGIAVPILAAGRVRGLLALESTRRGDFPARDVARIEAAVAVFASRWSAARFRAWHRERYGHDVLVDPAGSGLGALRREVTVSGTVRAPVALVGAEGTGKEILARWIHFETYGASRGCELLSCALEATGGLDRALLARERSSLGSRLASGEGGTVILDELDTLPAGAQIRLRDHLTRSARGGRASGGGPRPVAILRETLAEAVAAGRLRGDLASVFRRLEHRVPPLRERRDEIPALVRLLAARFAEEEGIGAPRFDESALALLWRQRWEGNVRELEGVIYKTVAFHPGSVVGAGEVRELARRFRIELVERLPSRRPRLEDLRSALRITRHASGSINKTRAALYLGWDPDTVAARLRDTDALAPGGSGGSGGSKGGCGG